MSTFCVRRYYMRKQAVKAHQSSTDAYVQIAEGGSHPAHTSAAGERDPLGMPV